MNIAFIPARCGSKSIPLKNIKSFCNQPLIYWSLLSLQRSKVIDKIVVATDCYEIKRKVEDFKFSKVDIYDRKAENAKDSSSTESVMLEYIAAKKIDNNNIFCLIQATSPLTQQQDIEKSFDLFEKADCDSLLSCVRTKRFFWSEDNMPINYNPTKRPRRQDFKGMFMENGAIYISSVGNIRKSLNRISGKIIIYEMPGYTSIEIDEEEDWLLAESLMKKFVLKKQYSKVKIFLSDIDGTLTDSGMYYGSNGEELKKFNTKDGKGFEILNDFGIKTGLITGENTTIVVNRAKKLNVDFLFQGKSNEQKLNAVKKICIDEKVNLSEVAYIGDDVNCFELLSKVGIAACPSDADKKIKNIPGIIKLTKPGGQGVVREFIDLLTGHL